MVYLRSRVRHRSRVLAGVAFAVVALTGALVSSLSPVGGEVAGGLVGPTTWVAFIAVYGEVRARGMAVTRRFRRRRAAAARVPGRDDPDRP